MVAVGDLHLEPAFCLGRFLDERATCRRRGNLSAASIVAIEMPTVADHEIEEGRLERNPVTLPIISGVAKNNDNP